MNWQTKIEGEKRQVDWICVKVLFAYVGVEKLKSLSKRHLNLIISQSKASKMIHMGLYILTIKMR